MTEEDPIIQTRLDVAEMKGMLTTVVSSHAARLDRLDGTVNIHEARLNDKGKTLARHDERLSDLEEDNSARLGRITGTAGLVIAALVALVSIVNTFRIPI